MKHFHVERDERYPDGRHPWKIVDEIGDRAEYSNWGYSTPEEAQEDIPRVTWMENQPVGVRVSSALSEARTVLSRLETAIQTLSRGAPGDPEREAIIEALRASRDPLLPFQRTGRMPKYKPEPKEEQ